MRTGVTYMGHHNPKHIETDVAEMVDLGLDDLLLAAQENDFHYFTGKLQFIPQIAQAQGLRPIAIFWGALNLFGGGRSSQFLLEHPEGFQVGRNGEHRPQGCYVNPICVGQIQDMIDTVAELGFVGYFIDEPTPLRQCYCPACRGQFEEWYGADLVEAAQEVQEEFRQRCVVDYVAKIAAYCQDHHPGLETMCCLMPRDRTLWRAAAAIADLDNLGTDLYWANNNRDVAEMAPIVREMDDLCRAHGKIHHEWLQCWQVRRGNEDRILEQGRVLVRERPDALYIWAWEGQIGTAESCADPASAWAQAKAVLALADEQR